MTKDQKKTIKEEIVVDKKSPLQRYAYEWLNSRRLFDDDVDYGGLLGKAVFELIKLFSYQGHSGFSAGLTKVIFNQILKDFKNGQNPNINNQKVKNNNNG